MNTTMLPSLALPSDLAVQFQAGVVELQDRRNFRTVAHDCATFARVQSGHGLPPFRHVLASIASAREGSSQVQVTQATTMRMQAQATQPDGSHEDWLVDTDPEASLLRWQRHSAGQATRKCFRLLLPRVSGHLQFWQTGEGRQLMNEAVPGVREDIGTELVAEGEHEALFYSVRDRNALLLTWSGQGGLSIRKIAVDVPPVVGTPGWELIDGKARELAWELIWESDLAGDAELSLHWGVVAAARNFAGRHALRIPDVSADFGDFFYQAYLGCLPLNLRRFDGGLIAPRCNVLMAAVECYKNAWSRDVTWGYEFLSLLDPQGVAGLIGQYLVEAERCGQHRAAGESPARGGVCPAGQPAYWFWADAAPEILILAGRHFTLTGDHAFARQHLAYYLRCADFVIGLIRPGEALPLTLDSWDGQGVIHGIEPYFTALAFLGLTRLAEILRNLGETERAGHYAGVATRMQAAALRDHQAGGLWHAERGTFINHIDHKSAELTTPRLQNWAGGPIQADGIVRDEFAHYETIFPCWLGLVDDPATIRTVFAWIDARYSYAQGRGGMSVPPFVCQTFMALLDVCLRQKYDLPGGDRLLQRLLDQAFAGGMPLGEAAFGAYWGGGPAQADVEFSFYPQTHSGRVWDTSPYFGLVMGLHYGLDYSAQGWRLADPKPLANYPLTCIRSLRHRDAVFDVTWEGRGRIIEVQVDGQPLDGRTLSHGSGMHRVLVRLAAIIP